MACNAFTELPGDSTPYACVRRVEPGTLVTLAAGGCVGREPTRDWAALADREEPLSLPEAGLRFATLLERAVAEVMASGRNNPALIGGRAVPSVSYVRWI